MPQTHALIEALKRLLKARAVTYAELAQRIGVSEASVKRMFSQKQFTLQRLDQILVAIGSDFQQLALAVQTAQAAPTLITGLTYAQEKEIIDDTRLFVVAVSALNLLPLEPMLFL